MVKLATISTALQPNIINQLINSYFSMFVIIMDKLSLPLLLLRYMNPQ